MAKKSSFLVRCEPGDLELWKAAAKLDGLPLSTWVRKRLASGVESQPPKPVSVPDFDDIPPLDLPIDDAVPIAIPPADVVSVGATGQNFAVFSKPKPSSFERAPKCTSPKCASLQTATCEACRRHNAKSFTQEES